MLTTKPKPIFRLKDAKRITRSPRSRPTTGRPKEESESLTSVDLEEKILDT